MKRVICTFLSLVFSMMLLGCEEKEGAEMTLYYLNPEANGLVQETYLRKAEQGTASIDELIEKMNMPSEAKMKEYHLESGALEIVFDESYPKMSKSVEVLFRAGMVQTLTQLPDVDSVAFYIEEQELCDLAGNPIGQMKAEDFLQNVGTSLKAYETAGLKLYFANKEGTGLVLERRNNVHYSVNTSIEKLVVENLMKGASSEDGSSTIASTVQLIGVTVRDGICYVNFDSAFLTEGYNQSPEVAIYSIVNSIVANGTVTKVQILVDGSSDIVYKGTVDLSTPLFWKAGLIGG